MNILIRNARKEDYGAVVGLLKQLWPGKSLNLERLVRILEHMATSPDYVLLCAEREHELIGFASLAILSNLWQEGLIMYLTTMIVDERHRRTGIGKLFMGRILEIALQKGCAKIELESAFHRAGAHAFYAKMGFEKRAYFFSKDIL